MSSKHKQLVALISSLILLALIANAQVFVSSTGMDASNISGSASSPFRTIVYAVQRASAGATIYITPGTYDEISEIYINKSLTLIKNGAGQVIIDAANRTSPVTGKYMLGIVNTSNVTINGLSFQNCIGSGSKAIWILSNASNSSNNCVVQNCIVSNIGWRSNDLTTIPSNSTIAANAIKVEGGSTASMSSVSLLNNIVSNCATGYGEAITVTGNVDGFLIAGNSVHEISNVGIDAAGNYNSTTAPAAMNQARNGTIRGNEVYNCMSAIAVSAGIYLDGAVSCLVERNKVYQNGVGLAVGGEQAIGAGASPITGHKIYNNLVYSNCIAGMHIGSDITSTAIQNTSIHNNTFYKNRTGTAINGVSTISGTSVGTMANNFGGDVLLHNISSASFQNNIVYPLLGKRAVVASANYAVSNYTSDYNAYYHDDNMPLFDLTGLSFNGSSATASYSTIAAFASATGLETNSLFANPSFNNAPASDFALTNRSPVINRGNPIYSAALSGTVDFASMPRVFNNVRIDVGAYEYQGTALRTIAPAEGSGFTMSPNPAKEVITIAGESIRQVEIINSIGKTVYTSHRSNFSRQDIPIAHFAKGIYIVRCVFNTGNIEDKKVVFE